jgi:hypothetical protein
MAVLTGAIEAKGEAGAVTAIDVAAVTAMVTIIAPEVIFIEEEGVPARDPDHLTTTGTIAQVAVLDGMTVTMIDPRAVSVMTGRRIPVSNAAARRQMQN